MSYGATSRVGISFQNSFGTSFTDSMHWLEAITEEVGLDKPPLIAEGNRGIFDEGEHYEGPNTVTGDINIEASPISIGALLKAALGEPSTSVVDSVYQHIFKPNTSDFDEKCAMPPFTMHKYLDEGGSASLFYDLNANNLEINMANGSLLTAKIGVVGGNFSQLSPLTASYPTDRIWSFDQSSVSLAAAAVDEIVDLTITIENNIEAMHTLNASKYPSRIKRTAHRAVNVSGTMKFDNQDEYQEFLSQSERNLTVAFLGDTEVSSGHYEELTAILPLNRHTEYKPTIGGAGEIEVSFSSKGVYSVDSATAIQFTLVNTQAGY